MKSKILIMLVALVGLAGLGWYAYTVNRAGWGPGFEVKGPAGAPPSAAAGGVVGGEPRRGGGAGTGVAPGAPGPGAAGPGTAGPAGGPRGGPANVEVARVERVALIEDAVAAGTLRANESVLLRSEVAGRIARVNFTDGARVARGTVLIGLDASIAVAEVEQSKAELGLAQANFQRTSELAERNFVSQSAKDQAAANLAVLEARLKLAQARLAKSEIRAPFNGMMGLRNVSVGDFVKDGNDLAVIEDVSSMKVDLRLPERYLAQLKPGQQIRIELDSYPGRRFAATLDAIDVQVDPNGRSLIVRGKLPNTEGLLRSGMYARATVVLRENPAALMVPEEALIPQGATAFVYRVVDGKATRTRVETGLRQEGRVEILKGLSAGDLVVTAGQLRLNRDVHEVRVIDAGPAPNGPNGPGGSNGASAADAGAARTAAPSTGPRPSGAGAAYAATPPAGAR
jgi:membrane fusion protein, multidrug efflux system